MLGILSLLLCFLPIHLSSHLLTIRGGLVPQADKVGGEYYEKYELDYGSDDKRRFAGALRGFLDITKLQGLKEKDPFLKWWNKYLEDGPAEVTGRLKPIYAADFGTKADLKKGEHPKIVIVQRKLQALANGQLGAPKDDSELDIEVREIKNPILRSRCNFAVRYVVPSRVNIIRIMEAKNRFKSEVRLEEAPSAGKSGKTATQLSTTLTFRPSLFQRLFQGRRDTVIKRVLGTELLYKPLPDTKAQVRTSSAQTTRPVRPTRVTRNVNSKASRVAPAKTEKSKTDGAKPAAIAKPAPSKSSATTGAGANTNVKAAASSAARSSTSSTSSAPKTPSASTPARPTSKAPARRTSSTRKRSAKRRPSGDSKA